MKLSRELVIVTVATLTMIGAGCTKKPPTAAATTPPPPAAEQPKTAPPVQTARTPTPAPAPAPAPAARSNMPDAPTRARIETLLARIEDAYFDYDKYTLRSDAIKTLEADSRELRDILKDYPDYKLTIEGHADERGSAEYNMALAQKRADAAKAYLVQVGIPDAQLGVISYGKEKPACGEQTEDCWQKNRRIHIVPKTQ